jgi:acyl-CoA synthetase (AMP-forming)/AMP-acid ligase II
MGPMPSSVDRITTKAWVARTLWDAGVISLTRPDRLLQSGLAMLRWGATPAAGYAAAAARFPDEPAVIDELGTLSFKELDERTNRLANALAARGIAAGDHVAVMCRNHRGFIEITVACSKLGAHVLLLNTSFAGPQIADVAEREQARAAVYDQEFAGLVAAAGEGRARFVAWSDAADGTPEDPRLEDLVAEGPAGRLPAPAERGRTVILTSGTTGTPKGASRGSPDSLDPAAALLSRIPLRARETTMIAAPLFHSWGFAHWTLGLALASTVVLRRRFDPEDTLAATAQSGATALIVVPVMVQRILELGPETIRRYDLSALRTIAVSGSALPGELAVRVMDAFGDKLYNLYGSTEVAWATIATPEDLRAAPGTAGRPPRGTVVRIYDQDGRERSAGETGRIFVGNEMLFEGYTGGGDKDYIDGLMATGDVGHFDAEGRLFVDGRDDDMIVSGGENVFPAEVEDLIAADPRVADVAVIGVPDAEFGQRLKAFVVPRGDAGLTEDDVKALVKANLARYKVPREVQFLDELPRNATGKVLRRDLTTLGDGR